MASDPRWTEHTRDVVRRHISSAMAAADHHIAGDRWDLTIERAERLLATLADNGLLVPRDAILPLVVPPVPDNPGETWQEWGYRVTHPGGEIVDHWCDEEGCWHEEDARLYMRMHLADHPDTTAQLIRRTAWYATSAWEVAP